MSLKITTLYDNRKDKEGLQEGWGFSALIETPDKKILFDTGNDYPALLSNLSLLNLSLQSITHLFFSHKHGDHIAGFAEVVQKVPQKSALYLPKGFSSSLIKKIPQGLSYQILETSSQIEDSLYSLILKGGFRLYEQALAFKTALGTVIITGCAHPGVLNYIEEAQRLIPGPIHLVMGGFHLFQASFKKAESLVQSFHSLGVKKAAPCHCSGDQTLYSFQRMYGDQYVKIGTGTQVTVG